MAAKWSKAPFLALWATEADGMGRIYVNPFTKERVPSVTSVLKEEDRSHLLQWAADMVARKAVERTDIVMGDPDRAFDSLRFAHNEFRDSRASVGTAIHQTVQADYESSWDYPELDDEQRGMMDRWYEFLNDYKVKILLNEFSVFGDGYAGTADLLIEYTDPFTGEALRSLVDIKTASGIHDTNFYQLAALKSAHTFAKRLVEPNDLTVTLPKKKDLPESYWLSSPNPALAADHAHVLQLREGFYRFEPVENIEENFAIFRAYLGVREAKDRKKEGRK